MASIQHHLICNYLKLKAYITIPTISQMYCIIIYHDIDNISIYCPALVKRWPQEAHSAHTGIVMLSSFLSPIVVLRQKGDWAFSVLGPKLWNSLPIHEARAIFIHF